MKILLLTTPIRFIKYFNPDVCNRSNLSNKITIEQINSSKNVAGLIDLIEKKEHIVAKYRSNFSLYWIKLK